MNNVPLVVTGLNQWAMELPRPGRSQMEFGNEEEED
jgi:hypothetical protein